MDRIKNAGLSTFAVARNTKVPTVSASSAKTTTSQSSAVPVADYIEGILTIDVTAVSSGTITNAETTPGVTAVAEVTTLTVTHAADAAGNVTVTLNGTAHTVAVLQNDTPAQVATKITTVVDALADYGAVAADAVVTITAANARAEADATFAAAATGVTATVEVTTPGVDGVAEVNTLTVVGTMASAATIAVAFNDGTINKSVNTAVLAGDTAAQIATKIAAAMELDANIGAAYTVTAVDNTVVFTKDAAGAVVTTITASGFSASCAFGLQTYDGAKWYDLPVSFSAVTAAGVVLKKITNFGENIRLKWTLSGLAPSFTFSSKFAAKS